VPLDVQADQFNTTAAQTERLMIVRNVMRARDRTSMVFTRIESFSGSMQRSISGGASLSMNEGPHNDNFGPEVSAGGEVSPSFTLNVLNDERFHRAIESSIDLGIYQSLIDDGWRPLLLHSLFIERVVENGHVYDNDPTDPQAFAAFQHWLNTDRRGHPGTLHVCAKSNPDVFSPVLDLRGPTDLSGMAAVAEQHLEFQQSGNQVRLVRPGQSHWFSFDCNDPDEALASVTREVSQTNRDAPPSQQYVTTTEAGQSAGAHGDVRIYVRSIEGVLFYLGELVRAEHRADATDTHPITIDIDRNGDGVLTPEAIFIVHRAGDGERPSGIVFRHEDGRTYYVPYPPLERGTPPDRTHQVITLLLQLIGVLQEREEVPGTQTVRVVP
jgi:hypothetical protein